MKTFEERVTDRRHDQARALFSSYVQSVAFNMTLSRNMVDALWAVREFGSCHRDEAKATVAPYVSNHSAPLMKSLERRGLVWHDWIKDAPPGHFYFKLTKAGELMCALLVEAGLIAAAKPVAAKAQRR